MKKEFVTDRSPKPRYRTGFLILHWLTVILLLFVGASGLLRHSWPNKELRLTGIGAHAIGGIAILSIAIVRIIWRMISNDRLHDAGSDLVQALATVIHLLMYLTLIVTPVVGIVAIIFHGVRLDVNILAFQLHILKSIDILSYVEACHFYLAYSLFGLVFAHVTAGLWHQYYLRDNILNRMLP